MDLSEPIRGDPIILLRRWDEVKPVPKRVNRAGAHDRTYCRTTVLGALLVLLAFALPVGQMSELYGTT